VIPATRPVLVVACSEADAVERCRLSTASVGVKDDDADGDSRN
jgi:hypothetical protein